MTANVTAIRTAAETALDLAMATHEGQSASAPACAAQKRAADVFRRSGLPHRRIEAWHYTDLRSRLREIYPFPDKTTPAAPRRADTFAVSFVDGLCASLPRSLPDGVTMQPLSESLARFDGADVDRLFPATGSDDPMIALNSALAHDGLVLHVAAGVHVETPLEIAFDTSEGASRSEASRCLVTLGEGASLTLIESHAARARVQRHSALIVELAPGARLDHVFETSEATAEVHIATLIATLEKGAEFRSFGFLSDGSLLRRQISVRSVGENTRVALGGVSLLDGDRHADTTLVVEHTAPGGESREFFKHIVEDKATGVFQGKIVVQPQAQKTDGGMKSHALLLSDDAAMYAKPELEIFADDVVCGHGATVGQLDENQLFYLMSRGLPHRAAEALLIEGFARESIDRIADERLRERLVGRLSRWLERRRTA